jgi:ferritin-like metal-binding protein YciE
MSKLASLRDLYIEELKDIYSAETQIVAGLPKMAKKATSSDLKAAFTEHLEQTHTQVQRLEQIFDQLGEKPTGKLCKGMHGIQEEAKELMGEEAEAAVMDAGLISQAQHVEHYEMAGYGSVIAYARLLGEKEAVTLLQATLEEEKQTDAKLNKLATQHINRDAK